jgi:hypothetical protein
MSTTEHRRRNRKHQAAKELVWIIDPITGDLVVEGLEPERALTLVNDLLTPPRSLNCAQPLAVASLPPPVVVAGPTLRVSALWHGSVVEGPGRRSVLQVQGCPLRCSPVIYSTDGTQPAPCRRTCWGAAEISEK